MSEITQYNQNDLLQMLKGVNIIPNECPMPMVNMFFEMCKSTGLNPLNRHAYIIPRNEKQKDGSYKVKYSMQVSIDGFRSIAEKTGQYIGSSEPLFDNGLTEYEIRSKGVTIPTTATVTVEKIIDGKIGKFTAVASWESYAVLYNGKPSGLWLKFPFLMLAKCAEALALRKAFPSVLGGLYTTDEMESFNTSKKKSASQILMDWGIENGLTDTQIINAKNKLYPNVKKLNDEQLLKLREELENIILDLKAKQLPKTELFATKDVEGVYGTD